MIRDSSKFRVTLVDKEARGPAIKLPDGCINQGNMARATPCACESISCKRSRKLFQTSFSITPVP